MSKNKQKRLKKKKLSQKASKTNQHLRNQTLNKQYSSVQNSPSTFTEPLEYWVGCKNKLITAEEVTVLDDSKAGISALIYPNNPGICQFMNHQLKLYEEKPMVFPPNGWTVVSRFTMMPDATFDQLDAAKQYVLEQFPEVQLIRNNTLGLVSGTPDFSDLPDMARSTDRNIWVDYCLQLEDNHGIDFQSYELEEHLIVKLISVHNAPQSILDQYVNHGKLDSTLSFISEENLEAYHQAFEVLSVFETELSRINN